MKTPKNQTEYDKRMESTGQLLTAIGWERAALVAMKVEPDLGHGGAETDHMSGLESASKYAERGYHGLTRHKSVLLYAKAWLDEYPRPNWNEEIVLPTKPFPPTRTGSDGYESDDGAKKTIARIIEKHGPTIVQDALVERMEKDLPFDTPPKMPWNETPTQSVQLSTELYSLNKQLDTVIRLIAGYEIGTDPTTDQALAESMNIVEIYEDALRRIMGLDVMT